jgi:hypothetical protein
VSRAGTGGLMIDDGFAIMRADRVRVSRAAREAS